MENGQNINAFRARSSASLNPYDEIEGTHSDAELMARRLKNRERQRRYRARKRLEAEAKKAPAAKQSIPLQSAAQVNGVLKECVNRVYCGRDWKKDARRAHALEEPQDRSCSVSITNSTLANEIQVAYVPYDVKKDPPSELRHLSENSPTCSDGANRRVVPGRRDWKAEARKKKD